MPEDLDFYLANKDDIEGIFKIIDLTGWGETFEDISRVMNNPSNKYLTVFNTKTYEFVGITLMVLNGRIGFIGHVIVIPEYRMMGIAEELMKEAINYMKFHGCSTIKLDAVEKAISLYERVGFKFEVNSHRYLKEISNINDIDNLLKICLTIKQDSVIRNIIEDDLALIFETDSKIYGGNREDFLFTLFDDFPGLSFIANDSTGQLVGYLFGTFRNGMVKLRAGICDSISTAIHLIKSTLIACKELKGLKSIKISITENSSFGIEVMEKLGFEKIGQSYRMYWGKETEATRNPIIFAIGDPAKG
ncbi:MAG: GNAT family N-acetyltransferase [Candidatus Heimdallarchaeota archaeon]|nr:GNAT family N-acetyltransferase [Candidatus Heimdallarchaeota archaeon]